MQPSAQLAAGKPDSTAHTAWEAEANSRGGVWVSNATPQLQRPRPKRPQPKTGKPASSQRCHLPSSMCAAFRQEEKAYVHACVFSNLPPECLRSLHLQPTGQLQATIICSLNYDNGILSDVPIFTAAYIILLATEQPVSQSCTSDLNIPLLEIILEPCLYLIPNNCKKAFLKHLEKD